MTTESSAPAARGGDPVFFVRGVVLLGVSFFLALLAANIHHSATGAAVVSWCETAAFWLGIVFTAGDVVAQVLDRRFSGRNRG